MLPDFSGRRRAAFNWEKKFQRRTSSLLDSAATRLDQRCISRSANYCEEVGRRSIWWTGFSKTSRL